MAKLKAFDFLGLSFLASSGDIFWVTISLKKSIIQNGRRVLYFQLGYYSLSISMA